MCEFAGRVLFFDFCSQNAFEISSELTNNEVKREDGETIIIIHVRYVLG